jgi:DNA-binding SARP family transcriptional activator
MTGRRPGPRSTLAGLAALATLIALVIGLPLALYWLGGDPLPRQIPAWHTIVTVLLHRDESGAIFLAAVRDVSWVAWAGFTVAVVAEAQAALRGRRAPRLRLAGLQNGASWLVALTIIAFAGQPAAAFAAVPAVPAASTTAPAGQSAAASLQPPGTPQDAAAQPAAAVPPATAGQPSPQVMTMGFDQMVTVRPGDCLWTIAQRQLGNGDLYNEIVKLNLGHQMGDGQVFTDPSVIWAGWVLQVPAGPAVTAERDGSATAQHAGHDSGDPGFSQPHPAASAPSPAANGSGVPATAPAAPAQPAAPAGQVPVQSPGPARAGAPGHTVPGAAQSGRAVPETSVAALPPWAMFGSGVLVGGISMALVRMRRRQRQARRPGRRIPLPASAPVMAAEHRLRAANEQLHPAGEPGLTLAEPGWAAPDPGRAGPDQPLELFEPGLFEPELFDAQPFAAQPLVPEQFDAQPFDAQPFDAQPFDAQPFDAQPFDAQPFEEGPWELGPNGAEPAPEPLLPPTALRAALSQLGASLLAAGQVIPDITAVTVRRTGLDLHLSSAWSEPPPAPFAAADGPQPGAWRLDLPQHAPSPPFRAAQSGDLLPGLLTAGTTQDSGYLLIDLEHFGVTTVDGPADLADLVLATAAAELTTSQLAGWYDLVLAGFPELGEVDGRATTCETLDEALDLLAAKAVTLRRRLGDTERADVRSLRLAQPGDEDWALTLLVSRTRPTPAQLAMLVDMASDPGGIAALVMGGTEVPDGHPAPASFRVRTDLAVPGGFGGHISPVHLDVRPCPLGRDDYEALATLFATAADQRDVAPDEPPYDGSGWPPAPALAGLQQPPPEPEPEPLPELQAPPQPALASAAGDADGRGQPAGLLIGVLGTFTVNGVPAALQPAQAQLVLALALNGRDGLSNGQLCYLLGADPDHPKPSDSLRQLIVRTRRQLGRAADGREWIEHLGAGQYALHRDARFDWADFEDLSERGLADRDRDCLRAALALIRGRPFAGCYHWWLDVAFTETVRAQIVDAASLLAELELAAGDPSASARAARTGLAADSAAEQLWRAVMLAEHASGNLAGVHEAWSRCLDTITDIAADGEPHPDTAALYQQLTCAGRAPASWAGGTARLRGGV